MKLKQDKFAAKLGAGSSGAAGKDSKRGRGRPRKDAVSGKRTQAAKTAVAKMATATKAKTSKTALARQALASAAKDSSASRSAVSSRGSPMSPPTRPRVKSTNVTPVRVANVIGKLDNKRGSTLESIKTKLMRCGYTANARLVRVALERAVKAGLLKEVKEERFSLPKSRSASTSNSSSGGSCSARNADSSCSNKSGPRGLKRVTSGSRQQKKLQMCLSKLGPRPRQRRPPQGRRGSPNADSNTMDGAGSPETEEAREARLLSDDDDAGAVGDGDVEEQGEEMQEKAASSLLSVSVSEPVAGCDAIMVFGSH